MPFSLDGASLTRIFSQLSLTPPNRESGELVLFFGVRGAVPAERAGDIGTKITLDGSKGLDYETMRCTIGQWWHLSNRIAAYRGSTVPTLKYVEGAADREGAGANQLFPGLYTFVKGVHRAGSPTGHEAFRELSDKLICRTADDSTYEPETDTVEVDSPADNLHAAWGEERYSSAGCQVVSGKPGEGQWASFKARAYTTTNNQFRYLLLPSGTWAALATLGAPAIIVGSRGDRARAVQQALYERAFLGASGVDGMFGTKSGLALLKWQRRCSEVAADAICTADDARILGIKDW